MFNRNLYVLMVGAACLLAVVHASARPDYYTMDFYTRTSDEAHYIDQGGIIDPYYIPIQKWSFVPRVTLEATRSDNYFLDEMNEQGASSLRLIPGALLIYGLPEHNHLYTDVSVSIPLSQSVAQREDGRSCAAVFGGARKTEMSQVYGRVGYRRFESEDISVGRRIATEDYIGNLGVEYRVSPKTSVGLNGQVEFHDYDDSMYIDYWRYYLAGRAVYKVAPKWDLFLQGGVGRDILKREVKDVISDATFYDVSVGMRGKPSPKTSVSGRIGYGWRNHDDNAIDNREHWIANLGAEVTPFGFSSFSAELLADFRPDINATGDSVMKQEMSLGVNRRLFTERLRGNARVLLGEIDSYAPGGRTTDDY
ncbi:MAG: porin family protein, partial [bacterium]|nr:porin family protein [bacterium]